MTQNYNTKKCIRRKSI